MYYLLIHYRWTYKETGKEHLSLSDPRELKSFLGDFKKVMVTRSSLKTALISNSILAWYVDDSVQKPGIFSHPMLLAEEKPQGKL